MRLDSASACTLISRRKNLPTDRYCYKLSDSSSQYGLDVTFPDQLEFDESRMSLFIHYANGENRDGVGDVLEVSGIDTSRHKKNPIVLFDHAKTYVLPIGISEDPETGEYTNYIIPETKSARLNCFFYQSDKAFPAARIAGEGGISAYDHRLFCDQLYDLAVRKYIRGGSLGYSVIDAEHIPPDYQRGIPAGMWLKKTLMLEGSLVTLPANASTISKALCLGKCCGKPLSKYLVKSLQPYAPERSAQLGWEPRWDSKAMNLRHKYRKDHCCANCKAGKPCTATKGQPSDKIKPAKARQILKDGEANGKPLTDKQRAMFGAAAGKGKALEEDREEKCSKYLQRLKDMGKAVSSPPVRVSQIVKHHGELGKVVRISDGQGGKPKGVIYVHFPSGARWLHPDEVEPQEKAMDKFHPGEDDYQSIEGTDMTRAKQAILWDDRSGKGIKAGDDDWLGGSWQNKPCPPGVTAARTGCKPQGGQATPQQTQQPTSAPTPAPAPTQTPSTGRTEPPVTSSGHVRGGHRIVGVDYSFTPGDRAKTRKIIIANGQVFARAGERVEVTAVNGHNVTVRNSAGQTYTGTDSIDFRKSLPMQNKKSLRDKTGRERASLSPATLANSALGTEIPTDEYKDLKAIRTKYRQAKGRLRRLRKSSQGHSVIRVRSKDVDDLRRDAEKHGVSLKWMSSEKGIDRVRLSGSDDAIEKCAKLHGRSIG